MPKIIEMNYIASVFSRNIVFEPHIHFKQDMSIHIKVENKELKYNYTWNWATFLERYGQAIKMLEMIES